MKGVFAMIIVGMNTTTNSNGELNTTLYVTTEFDTYYDNPAAGRSCIGQKTESVFVGTYDCSKLKIGMDVEIYYDKAVTTSRGTFQSVKLINIVKNEVKD